MHTINILGNTIRTNGSVNFLEFNGKVYSIRVTYDRTVGFWLQFDTDPRTYSFAISRHLQMYVYERVGLLKHIASVCTKHEKCKFFESDARILLNKLYMDYNCDIELLISHYGSFKKFLKQLYILMDHHGIHAEIISAIKELFKRGVLV